MKKLILCAGVLALAACGGGEAETDAMDDKAAMEDTAMVDTVVDPDSPVIPGNYDLAYADGTTGTLTIGEDGTYASTHGADTASGMVTEVDGKACFDPEGSPPAMCWTNSERAEDGSVTSTSDDGVVVKVSEAAGTM